MECICYWLTGSGCEIAYRTYRTTIHLSVSLSSNVPALQGVYLSFSLCHMAPASQTIDTVLPTLLINLFPLGWLEKLTFWFLSLNICQIYVFYVFFCKLSTFYTYQLKMLFLNTFPLHYNLQAKAEKYPLDPRKKSRLWLGSNP